MAYPSSQVQHGTEVTVVCDSGYTMFGNSAVVCKNGDFSGLSRCFKGNLIHNIILYGFLFFLQFRSPALVRDLSYLPYLDITCIL